MSRRERDIVLAALRLYAGQLAGKPVTVVDVEEIATCGGDHDPPDSETVYEIGDRWLEPGADDEVDEDDGPEWGYRED